MIQGTQLRDAIVSAAAVMVTEKQTVDALNIFPVPDGDTGTNMSMTVSAAGRELARLGNPTVTEAADVASAAMLRGARGNSGVILSLLFRGFAKGLKGMTEADGTTLAAALKLGVDAAYKAVMKPTEGTILTVAREAAEAGIAAATADPEAFTVWSAMCVAAEQALAKTPDLLPVLKKAGVVDAGGQGLCFILRAMEAVFAGGEVVQADLGGVAVAKTSAAATFEADIRFTYCTEFIVGRDKNCTKDPLKLRAFLESVGDCVVLVDDDDIIKVHVHTNDPGRVLHEAIEYGQFEMVKVENMRIQHQNAGWVEEAAPSLEQPAAPAPVAPENDFGFVAVAAGEGLQSLFAELGCEQIVSGGQTMNPSTDDILQAIEATPAKVVFVLPNNKNIILAAEQAIPLASRDVRVLPTRTVPQGVSAMLAFDPDASVKDNLLAMTKAADNVSTGQVTFAARNSNFDGKHIREGQILALANGRVSFVDEDVAHATVKLARNLISDRRADDKEVSYVTIAYGEGTSEAQAEVVAAAIRQKCGEEIDVTVLYGGQPVYYYILSVE